MSPAPPTPKCPYVSYSGRPADTCLVIYIYFVTADDESWRAGLPRPLVILCRRPPGGRRYIPGRDTRDITPRPSRRLKPRRARCAASCIFVINSTCIAHIWCHASRAGSAPSDGLRSPSASRGLALRSTTTCIVIEFPNKIKIIISRLFHKLSLPFVIFKMKERKN